MFEKHVIKITDSELRIKNVTEDLQLTLHE